MVDKLKVWTLGNFSMWIEPIEPIACGSSHSCRTYMYIMYMLEVVLPYTSRTKGNHSAATGDDLVGASQRRWHH